MHSMQFEITKPTDDSAFEDMCARIYGELFGDPTPKINGRRGQAQGGVDVFVNSAEGRIGIQSKRYADGALKLNIVKKELERAEMMRVPIVKLIVATTAAADATLLHDVQDLSDKRVAAGKIPVEVEFWEDICLRIRASGGLQRDYAPNAPGSMFHEQRESNAALQAALLRIESKLDAIAGLMAPPKHMRRTPIAQILNTPLPSPPSTGPVTNRTGLVEPPEIAPVLELIKGWLAQLSAIGAMPPPDAYVGANVTVGFGVRPAVGGVPVVTVAKNANVLFASSPADVEDGLVLHLSCIFREAKWVFSIHRKGGGWSVESHLEPGLKKLPTDTGNPWLHEESLAWERLFEGLADGSQLVGYFGLRAEPQAGPFCSPQFHPAPFRIDTTRLPTDWISRSLWRARRILLAFELARIPSEGLGTPLHWAFTPEFFDERITDECMRGACRLLRNAYEKGDSRWEHQLAELDGVPRVVRCERGTVAVASGFRFRQNHR